MVGRTGMRKHMAPRADMATSRMWKSMRQLRQFTRADIEATSEAKAGHVDTYVHKLIGAGYLETVTPHVTGKAGVKAVLRLAKNTGPVAPRFGPHGVYDANLEEPLLRPGDRPLHRHAPLLLNVLRLLADHIRERALRGEFGPETKKLVIEADDLILRSEGRA